MCVAVPVRDSRGQTVAAISVTAIEVVATLAKLEENLPLLFATARDVSAEMGHCA